MIKQTMLAAVATVACAVGAAPLRAYAEYPSVEKQMKLDEGMPMERVRALLGDPDSTDHAVCGAGLGKPWQCRTWTYGKLPHEFKVVFRKERAGWVVNGWES